MNTITLPRNTYSEILKRQARVESAVAKLQETVEEIAYDEIRPNVLKRLEKQSRLLDEGKGKHCPKTAKTPAGIVIS